MTTLPLHLGPLHPVEQVLVLGLAFGPFVVLAVVIAVQRRRDRALEEAGRPQLGMDEVERQEQGGP